MKTGDLVAPLMACAARIGAIRCDKAIIVEEGVKHRDYNTRQVTFSKYKALCSCGIFEEYEHNLEVVNESR